MDKRAFSPSTDPAIAVFIQSRHPLEWFRCARQGVLGVLCINWSNQATEAIKLITGIGEPLIGSLMIYDALK